MSATLHCTRGCIRWDRHLADCPTTDDNPCPGCEPRPVETGWLCTRCLDRLHRLLGTPDDHESIAGACQWLADNLGQHIRSSRGNRPTGDGSTHGDGMVTVMAAMADLQVSLAEMAREFTERRRMRLGTSTEPAAIAARLRPWLTLLADWEPIGDQLDHFDQLMQAAHAAAPWRGKDPNASLEVAAMLHLAPAETTDQICQRFRLVPQWLKDARRRHGLTPTRKGKPHQWRPWDVYAILHPDAAQRYLADLARQEQLARHGDVVWTSETERGVA